MELSVIYAQKYYSDSNVQIYKLDLVFRVYSVTDVTVDKLNLCVRCRVNLLNAYIDLYIVSDNKRFLFGKFILLIQQWRIWPNFVDNQPKWTKLTKVYTRQEKRNSIMWDLQTVSLTRINDVILTTMTSQWRNTYVIST